MREGTLTGDPNHYVSIVAEPAGKGMGRSARAVKHDGPIPPMGRTAGLVYGVHPATRKETSCQE
jgi:hypothetical protein